MCVSDKAEAQADFLEDALHDEPRSIREHGLALVRPAIVKLDVQHTRQLPLLGELSLLPTIDGSVNGINHEVAVVRKVLVGQLNEGLLTYKKQQILLSNEIKSLQSQHILNYIVNKVS